MLLIIDILWSQLLRHIHYVCKNLYEQKIMRMLFHNFFYKQSFISYFILNITSKHNYDNDLFNLIIIVMYCSEHLKKLYIQILK